MWSLSSGQNPYQQVPDNDDQDPAGRVRGLRIHGVDVVLDLLERQALSQRSAYPVVYTSQSIAHLELLDNAGRALVLLSLERQHRIIPLSVCQPMRPALVSPRAYVEGGQLRPVIVKGLVVELAELLCSGVSDWDSESRSGCDGAYERLRKSLVDAMSVIRADG